MKKLLYLFLFSLSITLSAQPFSIVPIPKDYQQGVVLCQFRKNVHPETVLPTIFGGDNFKITTISEEFDIYKISFDHKRYDEKEILTRFIHNAHIKNAQFNHFVQLRATPNDPQFIEQWNLAKTSTPSVWDVTTGGVTSCGDTIVVAVLDRGFDIQHNDLKDNIWYNRFDIPDNNRDDDNNGYIDDYRGWSFETMSDKHISEIHGTNCLGVIGAAGNNNNGITGINWKVKMLPLSVFDDETMVKAYLYAFDLRRKYNQSNGMQGAFVAVTSMSLGYDNKRPSDFPLICDVYNTLGQEGILNVVAATNQNVDIGTGGDIPGLCPSEYLIVVNSTKKTDALSPFGFSNKHVDLSAPGEDILTTFPNNTNEVVGGNSFAAPHVAGAVALLWSIPQDSLCRLAKENPILATRTVHDLILRGVDILPILQNKTVTGGRLNLSNSFKLLRRAFGMPLGEYSILKIYPNPVDTDLYLTLQLPDKPDVELMIVNTTGQIVHQQKIQEKDIVSNKIKVNMQDLASGIYFVTLRTIDYWHTKKLIITHR